MHQVRVFGEAIAWEPLTVMMAVLRPLMVVLLLRTFSVSAAAWQGNLAAKQIASFTDPDLVGHNSQFNHFAINQETQEVYVGAVNRLYRLNSSFGLVQNVSIFDNDVAPIFSKNRNKLLIIDPQSNGLITCGSANAGTCQLRSLANISDIMITSHESVASFGEGTTVGTLAPGPDSGAYLYVGATYTGERGSWRIPPVSRRLLSEDLYFQVSENSQLFYDNYSPIQINYVKAFPWGRFTFFVAYQPQGILSSQVVSKISRICHDSRDLDSYTEITLQCNGRNGGVYSLVQAAHVGPAGPDLAASLGLGADDQVLYALFAKNRGADGTSDVPTEDAALCVYRMTDILDAFREAVRGCINDGDAYRVRYLEGSLCSSFSYSQLDPSRYLCSTAADGSRPLYRYAKGISPTQSTTILELPGSLLSSVIVTTELNHTIAFMGTSTGDLLKVHVESNTSGRVYKRVTIDNSPVLRDITLDDSAQHIFLLTEQKLMKLRVENCSTYTTCEACIGTNAGEDGDPYCGWCTLERRCSRYIECPSADESRRWLPYNSPQCTKITSVIPHNHLPLAVGEQQIFLTVQQIPDLLSGESYECWFGSYTSRALKAGDVLTCISPPSDEIPPIEPGDDAVTVQLSVYSTGTSLHFVDTPFHFYERSIHSSCISCVESRWACDWCLFSNKCTRDSSMCTGENEIIITGINNPDTSSYKGPGFCPQLQAQPGGVLIPVGASRSIAVETENLPNPALISSYRCGLQVNGVNQFTGGQRVGDSITCVNRSYFYSDEVSELGVQLVIEWTDSSGAFHYLDDSYGFGVTLYKCAVGRPDCSRCVTSPPELYCVWCDGQCSFDAQCSSPGITLLSGLNCPDPILTEVYPTSGPTEGSTTISVSGTDLGRRFRDVVNVSVGDQPCDLDGLRSEYFIGTSISCRTRPSTEGTVPITVIVRGADGSLQHSSGAVEFSYKDPRIIVFAPTVGPEAGGTLVTVTGFALQTGRNIKAYIAGTSCEVFSVTDDSLQCKTKPSSIHHGGVLTVCFDGANRTSSSTYTFQRNPVINKISPTSSIEAGGRSLTVSGMRLDIVQVPKIVVHCSIADGSMASFQEKCFNINSRFMTCESPDVLPGGCTDAVVGFVMDDVTELLNWSQSAGVSFQYFPDPTYFPFEGDRYVVEGAVMKIEGERIDSAITAEEVIVSIGNARCEVNGIDASSLICTLPDMRPSGVDESGKNDSSRAPRAVVRHSNLIFDLGEVVYPGGDSLVVVLPIMAVTLAVLIVSVATVVYVKRRRRLRSYEKLLRRIREIHHDRLANAGKYRGDMQEQKPPTSNQKPIVLNNRISFISANLHINFSQLRLGKTLGQGAFGRVLQASLHDTTACGEERIVAVKTVQDTSDPKNIVKFLEEALIMKTFDHPNVLGLLGLTFDPDENPLVVLPLMANGDLKTFLNEKKQAIPTSLLMRFASHVALGMAYLAQRKFVHRDLAARNCMVDEDHVVKIADFGLSRNMQDADYYTSGDARAKLPIKWMAPESMERRVYNSRTDVWSYGVLLWEIFTLGERPYPGVANRDVYDFLRSGRRMDAPRNCPPQIYGIMQRCWQDNPKARCTFGQITDELKDVMAGDHDYLSVSGTAMSAVILGPVPPRRGAANDDGSYLTPLQSSEASSGSHGSCSDSGEDVGGITHSYMMTEKEKGDYINESTF